MVVHMRYMAERGVFDAIRSWHDACTESRNCAFVRYEDLTGPDQLAHFMNLMEFCDIKIPEAAMRQILQRLSFEKLSDGRKQGDENKFHKYRSGAPGDWKRYFDEAMTAEFEFTAGDLLERIGYESVAGAKEA
ncbi:MAG: sulfotransferase domain-containing protein [Planctomycetota bacterium]